MKSSSFYYPFLHPFLFLLSSIFFVYRRGEVIISPDQPVRILLLLSVLLVVCIRLGVRKFQDHNLFGLLLTVFILGVCSDFSFFMLVTIILIVVYILWSVYSYARKRRVTGEQVSLFLNFVGLILLVINSVSPISAFVMLTKTYTRLIHDKKSLLLANSMSVDMRPDIYYIVLDGYVRSDMLQELYGYDNSTFLQSLEEKGFILPKESRSNYPKTALSVPSTLNMDYISSIAPGLQDSYYWWLMNPLIDHSQVRTTLEKLGYQSISIMTDWSITDNPTTDAYYHMKPIVLNDFENVFLHATPLEVISPILTNFAFVRSNRNHLELDLYQFRSLANIAVLPGPKFVFAHIISPHPPFVVNKDGSPRDPGYSFTFNEANDFPLDDEDYRRGYVGQVQFVNNQIEHLVDTILRESTTPPIIIIQADHGSGLLTDFRSSDNTCLKERFSIFAAYYLPGIDKKNIPNDITPVNLFRIIFNQYFNANMPMLERFHYYYKDTVYIYRSEDVTSRVDTCTVH